MFVLFALRCVGSGVSDDLFRGVLPGMRERECVCGLETATVRRSRSDLGCCATDKEG